MQKKSWGKLLLLTLVLFALSACSSSSDGGSDKNHDSNWQSGGHQTAAAEDVEQCKTCHGEHLFGGTAGISCYDCHFGPTGHYETSTVARVVSVPPDDALTDANGNEVITTSLPNVAINTYVYVDALNVDTGTTPTWSISEQPIGSVSALTVAQDGMSVSFMPDVEGFYVVYVTVTQGGESVSESVVIYAGTWIGVIDGGCGGCHWDQYEGWTTTNHSTANDRKLEAYYDGTLSYYSEHCQKCHTVGYDTATYAVNDGYDDAATRDGFSLVNLLLLTSFDLFDTTYPTVAAMSNIQCENCHGPGTTHRPVVSLNAEVCGQCHNAPGYHVKVYQWELSAHSNASGTPFTYPTGDGRESCARCHTGGGFIDYVGGVDEAYRSTDPQVVSCPVCHDPHNGENEHMLRTIDNVTLANSNVVSTGGLGKLCMNCHQSRQDVNTYVTEYHSHFGPHYSPQTDVLNGAGGFEYSETISTSPHSLVITDSCVTCHMSEPTVEALFDADNNAYFAGQHTFKMAVDGVDNVAACQTCHSGITSFNFTADADYDGDGTIEGVQDEVDGLMALLKALLPTDENGDVEALETSTAEELKAIYNYLLIENDRSHGIHNFKYIVDLLQTSYRNLTGNAVPGATTL